MAAYILKQKFKSDLDVFICLQDDKLSDKKHQIIFVNITLFLYSFVLKKNTIIKNAKWNSNCLIFCWILANNMKNRK